MSTITLLPEEILRHVFYFATSTAPTEPLSLAPDAIQVQPFENTAPQRDARALGLSTRRNLNGTSKLFRALVEEFFFEDVVLSSVESVNQFAELASRGRVGWWVRKLKVSLASQWSGSTTRPAHANGVARILASCPRIVIYEDALLSGAGGVATDVLAALTARDSLRAIGWTGEAFPSTTDVRTLVESLPNLDTLHLHGCNPGVRTDRSLPPPPTPIPANMLSLRSLSLRLPEIRGADIFPLLTSATIPSLTHLTLVGTFHFGGNVAANTAALRQFFEIHGPQLESLDVRDDGRFSPAGPLVEFLARCTKLKEVAYPVSWTPPLCAMNEVETVGLRTVAPDLLLSASLETGQAARVALEYLGAHLDMLVGGAFPKLRTIRFLDDEMLGGYSQLNGLSPQAENYLTGFHARCVALGIDTLDSRGVAFRL